MKSLASFFKEFLGRISIKRDSAPLQKIGEIEEFVTTRAAFVAQKTLYGYVKTRMGTRYPSMFEDDVFAHSINIAKMHVFSACLSDLSVFAVGNALSKLPTNQTLRSHTAANFYRSGLFNNPNDAPAEFSQQEAISSFEMRLFDLDWETQAIDRAIFTESPKALYRWAPIADNLKKQDADIILNSINFTWSEIRQRYLRRLDVDAVCASIERNK